VLRIATSGGARVLGLDDALGRIAVGYRADIIWIDGEPDRDLGAIERVRAVVLDGVEQRLGEPGLGATLSLTLRLLWTKLWW
jgi:imidazolonepropionase-like amidohydrolase